MTNRVGILGWPVKYSRSPAMHNAAFKTMGLDWQYNLLGAPPERLAQTVTKALADGWYGFNVTIPHKRAVLDLAEVRVVEEAVKAIGAANTLTRLSDGRLKATNTDWIGFRHDLHAHGIAVNRRTCLILGTGGSAHAVAYALNQMGAASVVFASRSPVEADGQISYSKIGELEQPPTLVVNCTPLGMSPHKDQCAWPRDLPFPKGALIYDLVYAPIKTHLMARAQEAGLKAIGGIGMLVRQGAASFEQWTGIAPPLEVMYRAAELDTAKHDK